MGVLRLLGRGSAIKVMAGDRVTPVHRLAAAVRRLALALPLVAAAGPVLAQGACPQLEASLAALDRGANSASAQQNQAARYRADLDRLTAQSRGMRCDAPRGFLIFQGPPPSPECDQISDQISRLRSALAGIERGGDNSGQRRALLNALAQNNCGPQYAAAARAGQPQQQRPRNFFEAIFGGPVQTNSEESSPDIDMMPVEPEKPSYSRTVCVRTCDGYFFPMASSSNSSRFASDDALCKRLCPGAEAQLFTYSDDIRRAVSISGTPYMSLPNALRYKKEFVQSCTCKPVGQSWAQALAGLEDKTTLRKGDILVTEEQAKEMSQPRFDAAPGTKGKTASRAPAPGDAPAAAQQSTATAAAPLAPASEQPGQRPVRVVPLPRSQNALPQPAAQ